MGEKRSKKRKLSWKMKNMFKPPKCEFNDHIKKCKNEVEFIFKVKVFHPDSGRTSWQTWNFCKAHYIMFLEMNGHGWESWYRPRKGYQKPSSPVIDFK